MSEEDTAANDVYLYGIVRAEAEPPAGVDGVQGNAVRTVGFGRVAALVGDLEPTDALGTPDDLRAHTSVLDSMGAQEPVLPLAFGTVVPGNAAIDTDVLEPREPEYHKALQQLEGAAQYTLLVRYDRDSVLREIVASNPEAADLREAISGTSEDETRPQRIRLGEIVVKTMESWKQTEATPILDSLNTVASELSVRDGGQADDVVEVAALVRHEKVDEFNELVDERAEANHGRLRFRLVGPQAPYDFVSDV